MGKNGGARPGAGRPKLWDQAELLDRVRGVQDLWWEEIGKFIRSKDKKDRMFALAEINKLQLKSMPSQVTGEGGEPIRITFDPAFRDADAAAR